MPTASPAPPPNAAYDARRAWVTEYFDRTAAASWARLTSDAPVSGVRRTVRAGRDRMRAIMASWLPARLDGLRVLDAGCGTGTFATELAARGARVTAVDVSPTLVRLARERADAAPAPNVAGGAVTWVVGDMLDPALGEFDHVVAMDSLIHYPLAEVADALALLASRARGSVVATFAPATPLLRAMHAVGRHFPRADRAPAIEPLGEAALRAALEGRAGRGAGHVEYVWARTERVAAGFYTSQAVELRRAGGNRSLGANGGGPVAIPAPAAPGAARVAVAAEGRRRASSNPARGGPSV